MSQDIKKLNAIIEASKKLTAILDLDELLKVILEVAVKEIGAERGTVFLVRSDKKEIYSRILKGGMVEEIVLAFGQGIAGFVAKEGSAVRIDDAYTDPRFNGETDLKTGFHTKSILCLPINKGRKTMGVIQLLNSINGVFTEEDAHFLTALAAHMAIAIENAMALQREVEQERTRKELELAAQIQSSLLPESFPQDPRIEFQSIYRPCYQVGGDMYYVFQFSPSKFGIALADVSGKGIPAAMITSALSAYWKALIQDPFNLDLFCFRLNNLMTETLPESAFATMIFLLIDLDERTLSYCNCGHNPGLLISKNQCRKLSNTGVMLGMFRDFQYRTITVPLFPSDKILVYTDGLSEAGYHKDGEIIEFGLPRIQEIVQSHSKNSTLPQYLNQAVNEFTGHNELEDDMTIIAVSFPALIPSSE